MGRTNGAKRQKRFDTSWIDSDLEQAGAERDRVVERIVAVWWSVSAERIVPEHRLTSRRKIGSFAGSNARSFAGSELGLQPSGNPPTESSSHQNRVRIENVFFGIELQCQGDFKAGSTRSQ